MASFKEYLKYQNYLNTLVKNELNNSTDWLAGNFTKKDYDELLRPVLLLIKENPHASMSTLRLYLFLNSGIKELIDNFLKRTKITPGILLDFGTIKNRDTILCGLRQEYQDILGKKEKNPLPIEQNTIFDLASTSKLLTSLAILKLSDLGYIDLFEPIRKYIPEAKNLEDVTIYDLLKFRRKVKTDIRVDSTKNIKEAEAILFTAHPYDMKKDEDPYTDIGAMLLRYVVERSSKMPFEKFVQENILFPAHMHDTHLHVPEEKLSRVANENYSTIITKDGTPLININNIPGTPHDSKSIAIGWEDEIAPGHAGWFSTSKDMVNLGISLINGNILKPQTLLSISDAATGFLDDTYTRSYGSLIYTKQGNSRFLGVPAPLSGKAFMSPGFAGTTLLIDPLNEIILFIAAPRLHNRIYQIHPNQIPNIKVDEMGKKSFILPDGTEQIICTDYTKEKELFVKLGTKLSLQYQLLEKLFPQNKELHLVRELN